MQQHGWPCAHCAAWGTPPELFRMTMRPGYLSLIICKSCGFHQELDLRSGSAVYRMLGGEPEFSYLASDLAEHAYQFPPRCIRQLRPAPERGLARFPFHACFSVGCPCGERAAYLGCYSVSEGANPVKIFIGPLAIECPACGRVSDLLDTRHHGYDGELGSSSTMIGDGERARYACSDCGVRPMLVCPTFSYQLNDDDFAATAEGRPHDFFDCFALEGRCSGCDTLRRITDFECA